VTTEAAVRVVGLVKHYGRRTAVDSLDLDAPAGALTAVLGPNGAGKTTTVECCEGLRTPDAGSVSVLGLDPRRDARALRPRVGVMLQDGGLPAAVPAGQVLRHVAAMYARPRPLAELSATLGLDAFARTHVRRLSGGERQRLALAVAIVGRPDVAFLDEPTAGLDVQARLAVTELVRSLRDEGTTVVLTTHQMADAEALADHVVVVDAGRVVAAGTPTELVGGGGSVLVAFPSGAGYDAASLAARLATALTPHGAPAVVLRPPDAIEVRAAPDAGLLHAVTGWARADGVDALISTTRRTLEDVFLELTGRSLR
jgi:ABC-2 type transport system ATP-binding protein